MTTSLGKTGATLSSVMYSTGGEKVILSRGANILFKKMFSSLLSGVSVSYRVECLLVFTFK